jgi:CRISPR system Cascade subunit CasD
MKRFLVLRLDAPLIAFGGESIDNYGVIRPFPAKSMITGLLANALGIERHEGDKLQALQDSITMGSRINDQQMMIQDFQTAELAKSDQGWTTRGKVEGRASSSNSYAGPHLRYRDYWSDADVTVVFRVNDRGSFTLDEIERAFSMPARPLFVGRKSCIPSSIILDGDVTAKSTFHALMALWDDRRLQPARFQWPASEGPKASDPLFDDFSHFRAEPICDERNWITGVHCGQRIVYVLDVAPSKWGQS